MKRIKAVDEWIEKAEGDYETVLDLRKRRRKRQQYIIAFHCQQCIEKYIKALLICHKIEFPRQHDLEELLVLLLQKDPLLSFIRDDLKFLTPFAVSFRYPGEDITNGEVKMAVAIMKRIRAILRERLGF
jgi:HEPN domain-containing protein